MRSISIVIYMMGVVGINIYASDDRIEEIDNPSAIKFKSFVYDPSSKRFDGDFFEEAGHVFRELGAYYTGKYKRVVYENLPQAQDKLVFAGHRHSLHQKNIRCWNYNQRYDFLHS